MHPFDYRQARQFWGIEDVDLAARMHALLGGTPAYLDYADGQSPADARNFDDWVVRHVLNPSSAFFREGRLLVGEEPTLGDSALYLSVLAALSTGRTRRSEIAAALGRTENALAHPLSVLQETRLVQSRVDALRGRRTTYHIAEPMLRFHQLDRLRHIRTILPPAQAPEPPRLLLFSRSGFEPELRQEARAAQDVELIDLSRVYHGE